MNRPTVTHKPLPLGPGGKLSISITALKEWNAANKAMQYILDSMYEIEQRGEMTPEIEKEYTRQALELVPVYARLNQEHGLPHPEFKI